MDRVKDIVRIYLLEWHPRGTPVVAARISALFILLFLLLTLLSRVSYQGQPESDPSGALVQYLGRRGIIADPGSIHWISRPAGGLFSDWTSRRALFLAREGDDSLRDFYIARVRLTPSGRVASASVWNLSESPSSCEQGLWARGAVAAVAGKRDGGFIAVNFYDFRGEDPQLTRGLPWIERAKNAITNYQKTGQLEGINSAYLEFARPRKLLDVAVEDGAFRIGAGGGSVRIAVSQAGFSPEGKGWESIAEFQPGEKAISGHVAWIVDTARAAELIGKEKIGWAEAKWYRIDDFFKRTFYKIAGSNFTVQSIKEEMGQTGPDKQSLKEFMAMQSVGFIPDLTPPPVKLLGGMDPLESEGVWEPILDDIFNLRDFSSPPSLYRSFARPDPERPFAVANLVAWDPRMVELHPVAGVIEPKSETGRAGTGMIPRDDETLLRLVAGFNGGFQALHGEFGLMQDGKVYLPPKPWAATVALLKGGKIGFGTWPGPDTGEIPAGFISYRQNLTPLMMDSEINPYKRRWWGSSPDLNPDSPMIARSGICWTRSNHVVYALSSSVNEITFAEMMKRAGCHYLIQLDVNAGHSGFEFIRVTPKAATQPVGRSLETSWEDQGPVKDREDLVFRAKKLFKKMSLMRFPRYIGRDPRDFFYLTLTRNLPGPPIDPSAGEIEGWKVAALPGNPYPPRFAYAAVHAQERGLVKLVRADPRWLTVSMGAGPGGEGSAAEGAVLALPSTVRIAVSGSPDWSLMEGDSAVIFGYDELGDEWEVLVDAWKPEFLQRFGKVIALKIPGEIGGLPAAGAVGIGPDRFFAWAESGESDPEILREALLSAGASTVVIIPAAPGEDAGWSFFSAAVGGAKMMPLFDGKTGVPAQSGLIFTPAERAGIIRLFPETKVVLPKVWNPPQVKRIRYFKPEPDAGTGAEADGE